MMEMWLSQICMEHVPAWVSIFAVIWMLIGTGQVSWCPGGWENLDPGLWCFLRKWRCCRRVGPGAPRTAWLLVGVVLFRLTASLVRVQGWVWGGETVGLGTEGRVQSWVWGKCAVLGVGQEEGNAHRAGFRGIV